MSGTWTHDYPIWASTAKELGLWFIGVSCRYPGRNAMMGLGWAAVAGAALLEHFPEKWTPVFRRKCDQTNESRARSDSTQSESALVTLLPRWAAAAESYRFCYANEAGRLIIRTKLSKVVDLSGISAVLTYARSAPGMIGPGLVGRVPILGGLRLALRRHD